MLQMPERVRPATQNDEDALIHLCRELHAENAAFSWCEEKVRQGIQEAIRPHPNIPRIIGVIGPPKAPLEGAIYLQATQEWFTNDWALMEIFNFVPKPYRASTNACDLINYAKGCANAMRMKLIIGILSTHRTEAKVRLYSRHLGAPKGAFFMHDGTEGNQGSMH